MGVINIYKIPSILLLYFFCISILIVFVIKAEALSSEENKINFEDFGVEESAQNDKAEEIKPRTKRFIWYDFRRRRFMLPKGSTLVITPKLQVPFLRQPPEGLNSDIQISWPFYMFFDKLGMTSDGHPWPPFYPFSSLFPPRNRNRPNPDKDEDEDKGMKKGKGKRAILSLPPPERIPGGERAIIIPRLEKIAESFGLKGRDCLLRAICEIHEHPLEEGFGLFGEIISLLFKISNSKYAESHMPEYLKAEEAGLNGSCKSFHGKCPSSIFEDKAYKYSREAQSINHTM